VRTASEASTIDCKTRVRMVISSGNERAPELRKSKENASDSDRGGPWKGLSSARVPGRF
jgi:hypothetical protein